MILTAVDLAHRWACTLDDQVIPIFRLYDATGEPTDDPNKAIAFTAGLEDRGDGRPAIYAFAVCEIPNRVLN